MIYLRASPSGRPARRNKSVLGWGLEPAHNKRGPRSSLGILWLLGFRFARIALAPLNHIALASEPAEILVACSLYRLGQRRVQATVRRNNGASGR